MTKVDIPQHEEEKRLRTRYPGTWLVIDRIKEIKSRKELQIHVAECRAVCSRELLAYKMRTPPFDYDITWDHDADTMDTLIFSLLLQRLHERHWWQNFAVLIYIGSLLGFKFDNRKLND